MYHHSVSVHSVTFDKSHYVNTISGYHDTTPLLSFENSQTAPAKFRTIGT